ncbi:MAG TPA: hypothetical protein P5568_08855, partial [Acidobacteriota bacterium]|nr:hypothetical protein [Acidobacteriota bacterium]
MEVLVPPTRTHTLDKESSIGLEGEAGLGRPASPFCRPNLLLRDFMQERWQGVLPVLWGTQLQQARLDELLYLSLMNADHL